MTDLNSELLSTIIIDLSITKQKRKQKTDFYFIEFVKIMSKEWFLLVGATASLIRSSIFCWLIGRLICDPLIALNQFDNFEQIFMFLKIIL